MINLVWRQLIGFEMRRLPGIDRCMMAQGLYYVLDKNEDVVRSYQFKYAGAASAFPVTDSDDSLDGLGGDFSVDSYSGCVPQRRLARDMRVRGCWTTYVEQNFKLAELMKPHPAYQSNLCVIF